MYKLITTINGQSVSKINDNGSVTSIPFDPANTDYQTFKSDIANGAELLDADGNPITGDELTTFIGGLA
jgi:hypothetical protein